MKVPFKRSTWSQDMKPKISGNNLSLEYDNIESTLFKVGLDVAGIISEAQYDSLCDAYDSAEALSDKNAKALDLLQRSMLHFCLYEHAIFLITRIGNDGITVKKNSDETTLFGYQEDNLNNKLISLGWFWMNQLIKYLNKNVDDFTGWKDSEEKKSFDSLPVTTDDFKKWVGVSGNAFVITVRYIIQEVWDESVLSRIKDPVKSKEIVRPVCYEVLGRACQRLDYYYLPEPIRKSIDDSAIEKLDKTKTVRDKVAKIYLDKAAEYWSALDVSLKRADIKAGSLSSDRPVFRSPQICDSDSFVY